MPPVLSNYKQSYFFIAESGGSYGRQGDRYGSQSGPDPTEGNWRRADPDDSSRQSNYNDRRGAVGSAWGNWDPLEGQQPF